MKKIVTHNEKFHSDDVFAVATLRLLLGDDDIEIIRSRDDSVIDSADFVVDVGGEYDPERNRFDHHQEGGAGARENGIKYAAFGLVWKHYGNELTNDSAADIVDRKVVQPIDALDNGQPLIEETAFDDVYPYSVQSIVNSHRPTWRESTNPHYDETFDTLTGLAKKLLSREIKVAEDRHAGGQLVEKAYEQAEDKRLIILDEDLPWRGVLSDKPEPLFVVYQKAGNGRWRLKTIQEEGFENRKDLPADWGGKFDEELEEITGVEGAIFCHNNLFMAATETKEAALALAQKALEA